MLLQDDPCMELKKYIYKKISKSGLYRAIAKPFILLCLDVVEWMTRKVDHSNRILLKFEGKHVVAVIYNSPNVSFQGTSDKNHSGVVTK